MARSLLRKFETGDEAARKSALGMLASAPEISGDRSPVPALYQLIVGYYRSRAELISGPLGKATTHPEVQRYDTLIESTQNDLLSAARAHVALLEARIEALDEVRTKNANSLEQLPAAEAAETRLHQNAEALRTQGVTLRSEHQQARIAEAAELGQVKIVDLATRASIGRSTGPRLITFALLFGFLVGGAIALLLEGADRTVKRRDDLELSLHVPVLGTITRIESNGSPFAIPFRTTAGSPSGRYLSITRVSSSGVMTIHPSTRPRAALKTASISVPSLCEPETSRW